MSTVTLRWVDGKLMVGTDSNGHSIVIGKTPDSDQPFVGIKPSELLLLAAASCTMYDVVEILQKQREPLNDLKILCTGEQLSEPPYTFTSLHLHYIVTGDVNKDKLEKAIQLTEEKYCSVISTLRPVVVITSEYEVVG